MSLAQLVSSSTPSSSGSFVSAMHVESDLPSIPQLSLAVAALNISGAQAAAFMSIGDDSKSNAISAKVITLSPREKACYILCELYGELSDSCGARNRQLAYDLAMALQQHLQTGALLQVPELSHDDDAKSNSEAERTDEELCLSGVYADLSSGFEDLLNDEVDDPNSLFHLAKLVYNFSNAAEPAENRAQAALEIGQMHFDATYPVSKNWDFALKWFSLALEIAEPDDDDAQSDLLKEIASKALYTSGIIHRQGEAPEVSIDLGSAEEAFEAAAGYGHSEAAYALASLYLIDGFNPEEGFIRRFGWLHVAAQLGHQDAQQELHEEIDSFIEANLNDQDGDNDLDVAIAWFSDPENQHQNPLLPCSAIHQILTGIRGH